MCILCVIQKWSRKIATMLPWIVIPLIALWLLSQFLPPAFRFEITSPRLACVIVLLVTLFWYEVLMPRLSTWRARRNARLKERKRLEAIEIQKLKKNAVRKCRNCKTPYRDQNPSGGKFNCSYCGHQSKRPATDPLFVSPDLGRFSGSGIFKDLVEKVWSDNNWICGQDWLENGGNWVNGSHSLKSGNWKKNNGGFFSSGNDFFSFLVIFVSKSIAAIFLGIMWLFRKLFRISFNEDDNTSDSDVNGLAKKGENGVNCNETKSEKARRKAEEKRQARLEREQLEEEERKQREEVARLVEERRKVRDEIDKHINRKDKSSPRQDKKEAERKRQEKKKERDRGSNKSDVDELEKRASKELEKNRKFEDHNNNNKSKIAVTNSYNQGGVGTRYLDRMKGNFFASSKTLSGGGFFGKGNTREHRSGSFLEHSNKRDHVQPERASGKSNTHADDQNHTRPACFESQPCPPPKRSWHQLFTRSSPTASSTTSTNVISRPNGTQQSESQSSIAPGYPVTQGFDIPVTQALNSLPSFGNFTSSTIGLQLSSNFTECIHEEPDIFQDPSYVPDPASSTGPGPGHEAFDGFPIDLGFLADGGPENSSPYDSPVSQWSTSNENHADKGWQGWNSKLGPDTLGLFGANQDWDLPQTTSGLMSKEQELVPSNAPGFMQATTDDLWAYRTSYGSVASNNNHLPMNLQEGTAHNELVYGIPNGSAINHPFQLPHGNVWAKKEQVAAAPGCVEGIGTTSALISPGGGPYSPPNVQSPWSYE
ncbi:uncharacterized protein [Rutidosis leptorrhynchoides]|uniref:uncharacterized protein isoform X2 n=1 Tax=Rutidosis leptorrhynchoides TaxID=125765 RepID=UPI003A9A347E